MQSPPQKLVNAAIKMNSLFRIFWMGISFLFLLIGLGIAIFGVVTLLKAKESPSWPTAEGVITSSELESWLDDEGDRLYRADISYEYWVGEIKLTGRNVKFGKVSTNRSSDAEKILQKYPEGVPVNVYYNPDEYVDSVLEPGVHGSTWFMPIFGLVFGAFGFGFLLIGFFAFKPKPKQELAENSFKSVQEF